MTAAERHDHGPGFTLGIVVALPQEARAVMRHCSAYMKAPPGEDGVMLEVCGVGAERAAAGARRLIAAGADALLSWGSAAGIRPGFGAGTLLLPASLIAQDSKVFNSDAAWHQRVYERLSERLDVVTEPVAESMAVLRVPAEKQALSAATGAAGADMESAALARVALEAGKPFLVIRAVADPASGAIPASVTAAIGAAGEVRLARLLGSLLLRPRQWPHLIQLSGWFGAAQDTLMEVAKRAGPFMLANEDGV